jgi:hypothetical protein
MANKDVPGPPPSCSEMFDGTVQALFGVGLQLESSLQLVESDPDAVRKVIHNALDRLNDVIVAVRGRGAGCPMTLISVNDLDRERGFDD